jgi:hypothetical protein
MLAAEIAFLVCTCVFFAFDARNDCFGLYYDHNNDKPDLDPLHKEFEKAMIVLIVCHVY